MPARFTITNFSRGEFGPQLYGRVDVPHYSAGAKQLKNFIVQRYGGARFRDGFRFVAPIFETDISKTVKLLPFVYSIDQSYVLVMRDAKMNVAALGGMVLEEDLKIVSAVYGNPTIVEVPFHAMAVGDIVYVSGNTGPAELNGRFLKIASVPDASHIGLDINSYDFAALTASTGITRIGAPVAPPAPEAPPAPPVTAPSPPLTGGGGGTGGTGGAGGSGGLQGPQDPGGWYGEP